MDMLRREQPLRNSLAERIGGITSAALDRQLTQLVQTIPDCIAACVVDMSTGMNLGCRMYEASPYMDLMAAATCEMFTGKVVRELEEVWNKQRHQPAGSHYFRAITVQSDNAMHIFLRGNKNSDHVLALICRSTVSLGMALNKAQAALPLVEEAV
jgi:hypothetical protein